jgi:hypothetical protein
MEAFLTWIFEDAADLEATSRMLAFFKEKRILDPMGLGSVTTALAEQLFPGTSSVMTRLRYMLFIPWIYQRLESRQVGREKFAAQVEKLEVELIGSLSRAEDHAGVFGLMSGGRLKKMPSALYWNALGRWGIRLSRHTQRTFHRRVDRLYRLRRDLEARQRRSARSGDDPDPQAGLQVLTWHPGLPGPPEGFPGQADLALTYPEAEFLANRLKERFPKSLLAFLALECRSAEAGFPWTHPDHHRFSPDQKELLHNARLLDQTSAGAEILYGVQLADLKRSGDLSDKFRGEFDQWRRALPLAEIRAWDPARLWAATAARGFAVPNHVRVFLETWLGMVKAGPGRLAGEPAALDLVKNREIWLKGPRSRFLNRRALDQWQPGVGRHWTEYRWPTVRGLLTDLHRGLGGGGAC